MTRAYFIILIVFCIAACNPGSQQQSYPLQDAFEANSTKENADLYLGELSERIAKSDDFAEKFTLRKKGLELANKFQLYNRTLVFLVPLVKHHNDSENYPQHLFELGNMMHMIKKFNASDILLKSYIQNHGDHAFVAEAEKKLSREISNIDTLMEQISSEISTDPNKYGINENNARSYVDAAEAYAMANPSNDNAPGYLFKASEVAKSLRSFAKSLTIYDWIIDKYPNYEKAPTALFLKGFVIENEMKNVGEARKIYDTFLEKFPSHDLADDVEFLIKNLGKSDEQILKEIEQIRKNKEADPS